MRAVARLVLTYAFGTRILRIFSTAGIAIILLSFVLLRYLPQSAPLIMIPFMGACAFFLGSALMPLMFGRLAQGHLIRVLPWGRTRLLASVFITVSIVALPAPLLELAAFHQAMDFQLHGGHAMTAAHAALRAAAIERMRQGIIQNFWLTLTTSFLTTGCLYLMLWFITSQRSIAGYVKGLLVVLFIMYSPLRQLSQLSMTLTGSLAQIGTAWILFSAGFLLWPRRQAFRLGARWLPRTHLGGFLRQSVTGREVDLVLGTSNPWLLIGAQVVPIVFAGTIGFYSPAVWLFYLTIFSTIAGAIACQAAERSRGLWLRGGWSRAELFACVERSFWRHNSFVLGALIVLMVGIGSYAALPVTLLAAGLPLLLLGTVLSTYLGLMVTRGLRLAEGALAVAVMLALMAVAVVAARSGGQVRDILAVVTLEAALAVGAVVLRLAARSRWAGIDWALCRPERALRARRAA